LLAHGVHVDEAVHQADVATAEHLGRRVAETAQIFLAGRAQAA
jgi:hypothetical protein